MPTPKSPKEATWKAMVESWDINEGLKGNKGGNQRGNQGGNQGGDQGKRATRQQMIINAFHTFRVLIIQEMAECPILVPIRKAKRLIINTLTFILRIIVIMRKTMGKRMSINALTYFSPGKCNRMAQRPPATRGGVQKKRKSLYLAPLIHFSPYSTQYTSSLLNLNMVKGEGS